MSPSWEVRCGHVIELLDEMPARSVHCAITSPPYWRVRGYLPSDHEAKPLELGQEPDLESHIAAMVRVGEAIKRVLHPSGTLWWNYGDVRAQHGKPATAEELHADSVRARARGYQTGAYAGYKGWNRAAGTASPEVPPRNRCLIPERLAIAFQEAGWIVRQRLRWHKPNSMPRSASDRPQDDFEDLDMLVRGRNWYNQEAVRQTRSNGEPGRLLGSIWSINTEPNDYHTAAFPTELVRRCVLLSTSPQCCSACLEPYELVWDRKEDPAWRRACGADLAGEYHGRARKDYGNGAQDPSATKARILRSLGRRVLRETRPACTCGADPQPCTILDPFCGSGTTGLVALRLFRNFVGLELSPEYVEIARTRLEGALRPTPPTRRRPVQEDGQALLFLTDNLRENQA